jgi:hypothetical protein
MVCLGHLFFVNNAVDFGIGSRARGTRLNNSVDKQILSARGAMGGGTGN